MLTEKEYLEQLNLIQEKLCEENAAEMLKELDSLARVKPTRLRWYLLKSKAEFLVDKSYSNAYRNLEGKCWFLFDYDGLKETSEWFSWLCASYNDGLDNLRNRLFLYTSGSCVDEDKKKEAESIEKLRSRGILNYFDDNSNMYELHVAQNYSFTLSDYIVYVLIAFYFEKNNIEYYKWEFVFNNPNFGYLKERVLSDSTESFIIIATEDTMLNCELVATLLEKLGHRVFFIMPPESVEVDAPIDLSDTVAISMDESEMNDGVEVIPSISVIYDGEVLGDNRAHIVNYINENIIDNRLSTVLAQGILFDELAKRPEAVKTFQRLTNFTGEGFEKNLIFGWSGDYLRYISNIYSEDVHALLSKDAECDFSIVVPARNSSYYLRYTLETCLNQDYNGSYEIVVSDNSTNGNQEVYRLVQELNSDKIRYYKTPRNLHLPKSFEYAFVHARGEFIISVGSDDGILPYALTEIKKVMNSNPNDEIIAWDRGFYAWPGFNGGQQHQLIIPGTYKGEPVTERVKGMDLIANVLVDPKRMYLLPMLYINSGFRRSYFKTLINKTGRLWDGICQDIYIGIINSAINRDILTIRYPMTIAGMTNGSIGKVSGTAITSQKDFESNQKMVMKDGNVGGFCMGATERLMPELGSDVSSLYNCILRAVARGVLPEHFISSGVFNLKKWYLNCFDLISKADVSYDLKVHYAYFVSGYVSEEFAEWFRETVYPVLMKPVVVGSESDKTGLEANTEAVSTDSVIPVRTYQIGEDESGARTYDASEYGVENIFDATRFFVKNLQ